MAMRISGVVGAAVFALACGSPPPAIATGLPGSPIRSARPSGPAIGGFRLGTSFARAGLHCMNSGFEWSSNANEGVCTGAPMSPGYPVASVALRECRGFVCGIVVTLRDFEGETQLEEALADLASDITARYAAAGGHLDRHDGDTLCIASLAVSEYQCLLEGRARYRVFQSLPAPGSIALLMATGASAREAATVTITFATQEMVETLNLEVDR